MKNVVEQRVRIDAKQALNESKKLADTAERSASKISKGFQRIKSDYSSVGDSLRKESSSIKKSLGTLSSDIVRGGSLAGLTAGVAAFTASASSAAKATGDFDKTFKRLEQRFDFSQKKVKGLREEFKKLSGDTGVLGGEIAKAGEKLLSISGGKSTEGLRALSQFSGLAGDELTADSATDQVINFLKGQGKEVTGKNIEDVLTSANSLYRKGDFSMAEALKVSTGTDANALGRSGLSIRENAGLIAGASKVGQDKASTTAAIQGLIKRSVEGFGKGSALAGILGVEGSLLSDGKFDIGKLKAASKTFGANGLNDADSIELLKGSGLSEQEAEGLFSILKDFDTFEKTFSQTVKDQKTLSDAFKEGTKTLPDALARLRGKIVGSVDDITSPLTPLATKLLDGDFSGALGDAPGAMGGSLKGIASNPMLIGGLLGGAALSGGLLRKTGLLSSGSGIAKGMAISEATGDEVQPVYVVNAGEIGGGNLGGILPGGKGKLGKIGGMLGKTGTAIGGALAKGASLLGPAAAVGGSLAAGYGVGTLLNDKYIKNSEYKSADGFEGNFVEQMIHGVAKLLGSESARKLDEANKIVVEIDSKDERFVAKPRRKDNATEIKAR